MLVFLSISTERIAECIRQKLPYADVFPADSEEEIERNLTEAPPPIGRQVVKIGGEEFQLPGPVGCFIRGAGTQHSIVCATTCTNIVLVYTYMYVYLYVQYDKGVEGACT